MSDPRLKRIREIIQEDVGQRGLRADPFDNLLTRTVGDFAAACRSIAGTPHPVVGVITGFFIPQGQPPATETDGPLGALFLARALAPLGVKLFLATDHPSCADALDAGLEAYGLRQEVLALLIPSQPWEAIFGLVLWNILEGKGAYPPLTHLIALESPGPSHTPVSVAVQPGTTPEVVEEFRLVVPEADWDRCHTMRGRDITDFTESLHLLFEGAAQRTPHVTTIGIGDGGNEIGMGKIPWDVIRRNIPNGAQVACRVPADHLIVAGVSNWGAYGLAAGVRLLRGCEPDPELFDPERERELLRVMVEKGPLVDGVTGRQTVSVDGLDFDQYVEPLRKLAAIR